MDIKACHKALEQLLIKSFNLAFTKGMQPTDQEDLQCNDTDNVKYKIHGVDKKLTLYMMCIDVQKIWNYSGKYFVQTYYPQFPVKLGSFKGIEAVQIVVDNDILTKFTSNFKEVSQSGILTGKKKLDAVFNQMSRRMACIKRHFFASPFQMMLNATKNNFQGKSNENLPNLSFYTKPDRKQKIWLAFEKTQFTVYYGVNFDDKFEQQLAKIYFSELVDAKKHVHNAPSVAVYESQLSQFLINSFPEEKKQKYQFSNGIVSVTLFGKLVRGNQKMASYLAGFRNYAYYHIQASKCYLHSRVLRRINHFQRDLTLSKIQEIENK